MASISQTLLIINRLKMGAVRCLTNVFRFRHSWNLTSTLELGCQLKKSSSQTKYLYHFKAPNSPLQHLKHWFIFIWCKSVLLLGWKGVQMSKAVSPLDFSLSAEVGIGWDPTKHNAFRPSWDLNSALLLRFNHLTLACFSFRRLLNILVTLKKIMESQSA